MGGNISNKMLQLLWQHYVRVSVKSKVENCQVYLNKGFKFITTKCVHSHLLMTFTEVFHSNILGFKGQVNSWTLFLVLILLSFHS